LREAVVGPAVLVLAAVLLVTVVRSTVATPVRVSSSSMLPTLARGDVVLVDPEVAADDLEHGDVITFTDPEDGRTSLKRVVGLPGERLVIKDAVLHVDDEPVDEPYVDHEAIDAYYTPTFSVPAGSVFLMGDNRSNSEDSRSYGSVITNAVQGRVLVRVWPPVRFGGPHGRPPKP
jgi:signal peptidase I